MPCDNLTITYTHLVNIQRLLDKHLEADIVTAVGLRISLALIDGQHAADVRGALSAAAGPGDALEVARFLSQGVLRTLVVVGGRCKKSV